MHLLVEAHVGGEQVVVDLARALRGIGVGGGGDEESHRSFSFDMTTNEPGPDRQPATSRAAGGGRTKALLVQAPIPGSRAGCQPGYSDLPVSKPASLARHQGATARLPPHH